MADRTGLTADIGEHKIYGPNDPVSVMLTEYFFLEKIIMQIVTLMSIDPGKHYFHVYCQDKSGKALLKGHGE